MDWIIDVFAEIVQSKEIKIITPTITQTYVLHFYKNCYLTSGKYQNLYPIDVS